MDTVSQNGILKEDEFGRFKERTVKLRFMQQISYGLGAAMVFGLFTAVASKLVPLALGSAATATTAAVAASIPAMIGLGAIAVLGIGLIYMSANFLSENVLLEQDFQAKKIGLAARGTAPAQEIKPVSFPAQDKPVAALDVAEGMNTAQPTVNAVQLQERVVPIDVLTKAKA